MDVRTTLFSPLTRLVGFIVMLWPMLLSAQAVNQGQITTKLNDIIRDSTASYDLQLSKLDTLIANANALRADKAENAVWAYKLLLNAKHSDFDNVKARATPVLQNAIRSQDYRSQGFALRALLAYQANVSPTDTVDTKQQLMGLLTRRIKDLDKAQILHDIGVADQQTGNVMSALDFLEQAQDAYWQLANYMSWRQVIELQFALLLDMQWFKKAQMKLASLVTFLQTQSGKMPFGLTEKMLSVMAAENQWDNIESTAMKMLDAATEANNIQAQFEAGVWLMHVNLQHQQMDMADKWLTKLNQWQNEYPQISPPTLFTLDRVRYYIERGDLVAAQQLQANITTAVLQSHHNAYVMVRQHLLNQVALAVALGDLDSTTQAYNNLLTWVDDERNRVLALTMEQVSSDFNALQQVSQQEINSLNQSLASHKESVGREATFNNLLIGIVCLLTLVIAVLSYFYVRLKNQKHSTRRRRRLRSA